MLATMEARARLVQFRDSLLPTRSMFTDGDGALETMEGAKLTRMEGDKTELTVACVL